VMQSPSMALRIAILSVFVTKAAGFTAFFFFRS